MPALISGTQALGEPRYPSLKGIMAARSKEITTLSLADLGIDPGSVGLAGATTKVVDSTAAGTAGRHAGRPRGARRGRPPGRRLPRRTEAHLMAGIWVHGELAGDGSLDQAEHRGRDARPSVAGESWAAPRSPGVVIGADPSAAAEELARIRAEGPGGDGTDAPADHAAGMIVAQRLASLIEAHDPDIVLTGAGSGGPRPRRGAVGADRLGRARQRDRRAWDRRRPGRDAQRVRRQAHHRERASTGGKGIITVRPNSVTAEPADVGRDRRGRPAEAGELRAAGRADRRAARRARPRPPRSMTRGSSSPVVAASAARTASA